MPTPGDDPLAAAVTRAAALNDLGRHELALQLCARALASRPDDTDLLVQAALALLQLGRAPEAVTALSTAAANAPESSTVHRLRSAALLETGDATGAEQAALLAVRLAPDDAASHVQVARAAGAVGHHDRALAAAQHAVQLAPDDPGTHLEISRVVVQPGARLRRADVKLVERHLSRALDLEPGHVGALNERARVAMARGRRADAAAALSSAVRAGPTDAVVLANVDRLAVALLLTFFSLGVVIWVIGVRVVMKSSEALSPGFIVFIGALGVVSLGLSFWLITRRVPRSVRRGFARRFVGQQPWGRWWAVAAVLTVVLWTSSAVTSGGVSIALYLASGAPLIAGAVLAGVQQSRYEKADQQKRSGASEAPGA